MVIAILFRIIEKKKIIDKSWCFTIMS